MIVFFFIILSIISFVVFFKLTNYSLTNKIIIDKDFKKIQAFHKDLKSRIGGICFFISFIFFYFFLLSLKIEANSLILYSVIFFLIGLFSDLKIINNPNIRFVLMIVFIFFFLKITNFRINNYGFDFFHIINNIYFSIILALISLFLVINGANLIDGFNGLLSIHILIISIIYSYLAKIYNLNFLFLILISIILINFIFLYFNFIKKKLFIGDSGAYFLGSLISIIVIEISNTVQNISPFFFAVTLFYFYFEVVFSIFRKIFEKKNPFLPDENHLHMLFYKLLNKLKFKSSNNKTGLFLNTSYLIMVFPIFFYLENNFFCQIHFLFMHIFYIISYLYLREKK
jgi:UDP-N-acetylmuramyl pentapeptide phosphotransferase/UDP-N-acetylglucosamine-1-phosphate transferase